MVVPGSQTVKAQAEKEGLHEIFIEAGFEWRESGCSMCLGMNPDILMPGGAIDVKPQLRGGKAAAIARLVSPQMAAAAAIMAIRRHPHVDREVVRLEPAGRLPDDSQRPGPCAPASSDGRMEAGGNHGAFLCETGLVAPLDRVNVDTDQIIPKQFLKRIERTGFGQSF